jgi:hypothetical protein
MILVNISVRGKNTIHILNDCSRSRLCPCYEIFAAFMLTVNFFRCHFLGEKCAVMRILFIFFN